MAYYFAVETTESSYEGINIQKTEQYQKVLQSEPVYEGTLEAIDKFTTQYNDETRLRHDLYSEKMIAWCNYYSPLSILDVNGLEVRKVQGNILFADSKDFIENPNLVIEYITKKFEESDIRFFRELSSTLPETSITTYMISKLATAMEDKDIYDKKSLIDKLKYPLKTEVDENLVSNIAKSLVQYCYLDGEGELIFSDTLDYERFHATVSFISEYEEKLNKDKNIGPKRVKTKGTSA